MTIPFNNSIRLSVTSRGNKITNRVNLIRVNTFSANTEACNFMYSETSQPLKIISDVFLKSDEKEDVTVLEHLFEFFNDLIKERWLGSPTGGENTATSGM